MLARLSSRQWLLAMAALSIAGVGAALYSQYVLEMLPCPWCILQRLVFVVIALVCAAGALVDSRLARRIAALLAAALATAGSVAALYQHFVAAKSNSCALTLADKILTATGLESIGIFQVKASCADAAVSLLGVPFEFWSLALFVVLAAMAARVVVRP